MSLKDWTPRAAPGEWPLPGVYSVLEPIDCDVHLTGLTDAVSGRKNNEIWRYMPDGPYKDEMDFRDRFGAIADHLGWAIMVIRQAQSRDILGMSSYMRLRKSHGSVEVGAVAFGSKLKRSREATEAMYLMASHVFDELGYRRYEWKCHNDNAASRRAAERFGFKFEGVFRNDMVVKGTNRDTAWFAMTDADWPAIKAAFQAWLSPSNFDAAGQQKKRLEEFRA
ncbi:MAG: GNAT family protein [Henriciella sp.]|nr:GNAT family protein [Henriciella sp.]